MDSNLKRNRDKDNPFDGFVVSIAPHAQVQVYCKFIADFTIFFYNFSIFSQWPLIFYINTIMISVEVAREERETNEEAETRAVQKAEAEEETPRREAEATQRRKTGRVLCDECQRKHEQELARERAAHE